MGPATINWLLSHTYTHIHLVCSFVNKMISARNSLNLFEPKNNRTALILIDHSDGCQTKTRRKEIMNYLFCQVKMKKLKKKFLVKKLCGSTSIFPNVLKHRHSVIDRPNNKGVSSHSRWHKWWVLFHSHRWCHVNVLRSPPGRSRSRAEINNGGKNATQLHWQ